MAVLHRLLMLAWGGFPTPYKPAWRAAACPSHRSEPAARLRHLSANVAWRMMLKDQERSRSRGRDLIAEPSHPDRAQLAVMLAVDSQRVEIQEARASDIVSRVNEAV
jgi:hypothetical protein